MSYRMEPIFNCAICGEMATAAAWESVPFGCKVLPSGWVVDADAEVKVDE